MSPTLRRRGVALLTFLAVVAGLGYGGTLGALYFAQERILFPATPLPADHRFRYDVPFEEWRIPVPGAVLDGLSFPRPAPKGLVFYLHGNAGNLETWTTGIDFYARVNYDLFIFDYRGYGKSTGTIGSEAELVADVRAAWDAIAPRYAGKPIVVVGRSLGTGLAARLARDVDPALTILISPYASVTEEARRAYPFVPAALVRYPLTTDRIIGDLRGPILLLHGSDDRVIPPEASRRLLERAGPRAERVEVPGAGHNDIHRFPLYVATLEARLAALAGR